MTDIRIAAEVEETRQKPPKKPWKCTPENTRSRRVIAHDC